MDDIHVNISDGGSEGEDTEMEMEEEEEEPELDPEPEEQEVLRKKIKTEHKKQRSTSAAKPPQPSVSGTRRKSKYWSHFHRTTDPGAVKCKYCGKLIRASSRNGTSALKNHLDRCKKSMFDFYASSLPQPKRKIEGLSCASSPLASSVPSNELVLDVNKLLSMKYRQEKGTLESEKKSELHKYLCDECLHDLTLEQPTIAIDESMVGSDDI
ncbi:hypothetical protein Cgig2_018293 [Carnegiea gigantea]|uniref:BED-type domain-containing protein n=1 Tax=Carnegiea gigantea TaxID=171969 RepID=A0A9Q1KZA9_9CARY|nr:hypothetical protein Cgig2_018293 [Carnegiea gigantea]